MTFHSLQENLGEDDVETSDGYVEITGIDPGDFGLSGQSELKQNLPYDIKGVVEGLLSKKSRWT